MKYKTCLIEINSEEIPANKIRSLATQFKDNIIKKLNQNQILFSKIQLFDSPRRIAIKIIHLNTSTTTQKLKIKGPSIKNSFDKTGKLTIGAEKWLKKFNISIKQTSKIINSHGKWLCYEYLKKSTNIKYLIKKIIIYSIKKINIEKSIQLSNDHITFIRPIKNIIILIDNKFIPFKEFNLPFHKYLIGNISTIPLKIKINHANEYENVLYKKGKVIANFYIRKKIIELELKKIEYKLNVIIKHDIKLLNEISCLVEWPTVLYGKFKKNFLKIPHDILIYVIEKIQKYFPVYSDKKNNITNYFIIVSNVNNKNNENIITGNEHVLNSRLFDISFFLEQDYKIKLSEYFNLLKNITFHEKLGTIFNKSNRLMKLITIVSRYTKENIKDSIRVAYLSKCDLKSQMVYEFPELQGTIGMYYALYHQEPKHIALCLKEQYQPNFSGDKLPNTILGCTISITDKIDTIVGLFLINQIPTTEKDPFGMRRMVIAIIRIIIEKKININLYKIFNKSILLYKIINNKNIIYQIMNFILNRLHVWYHTKKYNMNIVNSVFSKSQYNILNIHYRIKTISGFLKDNQFVLLIISYKRIKNLLNKFNNESIKHYKIYYKLIQNQEEKKIFYYINDIQDTIYALIKKKKYSKYIQTLFILNKIINIFIENYSIEYKEKSIKINRIILLNKIKEIFSQIADFGKI